MVSRPAAASATVRAMTPSVDSPAQPSPNMGPGETRPRDGLRPTVPQQLDGMRTEPPPSEPCAKAQSPAATAAAAPPLDPPGLWSRFQGLWVAPKRPPSVVGRVPNSEVLVLPRMGQPASFRRATGKESAGSSICSKAREPSVVG